MGEKCIQTIIDQISQVKIISTVWLNHNQIIVSHKGNTICVYNVFDGKFLYVYYIIFL